MTTDRFIPFRKQDITQLCIDVYRASDALAVDIKEGDARSFKQFCEILSYTFHVEYHQCLTELKNDYAPFDPNADTQLLTPFSVEEKAACQQRFALNFAKVLNAANFEKITEQDLQEALTEESLFKVRLAVEFDDFEQVVFYRRGQAQVTETLVSFFGLRKTPITFTNYDRVAVYITFKDEAYFQQKYQKQKVKTPLAFEPGSTIVKLFQNVPKADLEMLFPNSEVRMRPIDKVIIGASAVVGGAVVLVTKLGASLVLLAALLAFWFGWRDQSVEMTQQHWLSFAIGLGVFGSFVFREWTKFKNRKIKFMKALTDNLYFKNLDNNAGVFHTLIDAAEDEDFKEALLAYTFLLTTANSNDNTKVKNTKANNTKANNKEISNTQENKGLTATALDNMIEAWFKKQHKVSLDFEIEDALAKLVRLQLVTVNQGIYQAVPLAQAKAILDNQWDNLFNPSSG